MSTPSKSKYECVDLALGKRAAVEVQKHVVPRSILKRLHLDKDIHDGHEGKPELARHELGYDRSMTGPSCYDIIEITTREIIRSSNKEAREDDDKYTWLALGDDYASDVSSCNESNAVSNVCNEMKRQRAQEAAEAEADGHREAGSSAILGRRQRDAAAVSASPQFTTDTKPDPPGLTAVRLLFQLLSPGYRELLARRMDCLWVLRICEDKRKAFLRVASPESVMRLCKEAAVQPKLVRPLQYHMHSPNCWLIELHSPQDGHLFSGKDGEYTFFFENHLYIWQKIKINDLKKPTEWHISNLPPYLAKLSGEKLKMKIEALDKKSPKFQLFRSLENLQHDYLSGTCVLRGITEYRSEVFQDCNHTTRFILLDKVSDGSIIINMECAEQCTFCGLDCSVKGDADYHDAQSCPYKTILKRHKARQAKKNTRK